MAAAASVALLGYGRFGRALASLLLDGGIRVAAYDPKADIPKDQRVSDLAGLAARAEYVIAAVPVAATKTALAALRPHLTPKHIVLDVASVKHGPVAALTEVLGRDIPWAATHPLFGPMSIARGERPLRAVVCPNALHPGAAARARTLYESVGCVVVEEDSEEHDRIMAGTHALAFFVAKGMLETGAGAPLAFAPPSFQAMAQTIDAVSEDAGHLFYPIAHGNPFASAAREKLLDALARIHQEIKETPEAPEAVENKLGIPQPAGPAPELRETRDLIDELDLQLVDLLGRRIQLAYHAARVKSEAGRPLQDPVRERELLTRREEWAKERKLLPEEVRAVFESILNLSRAEQKKWLTASLARTSRSRRAYGG